MTITFHDEKQTIALADLRKEEEEELVKLLSDKYGLPYIDLRGVAPEPDALLNLKEKDAREAGIVIFKAVGKKLYVAALAPENQKMEELLRPLEEKNYELLLFMASHASLEHVYSRYADVNNINNVESGMLELTPDKMTKIMGSFSTVDELRVVFEKMSKRK